VGLIQHRTNSISKRIIGAAIEVHRHLGPGLLESSYETCLCRELDLGKVSYESQLVVPTHYKGVHLPKGYIIDLLVEDAVVVEIKSIDVILPIHLSQLMTYMRLRGISSGLLLNFNVQFLHQGIKRLLL
jgi:GxxExxY protein